MMIRYGLIGAGMMGQEHIHNISLCENAAVTAIFDPDEAMRSAALGLAGKAIRNAARHSVTAFTDITQMLAADVCDAYIIASPNHQHLANLQAVIPAGKPILCEKPLGISSAQCQSAIKLAQQHSCPVWVAMEYRYMQPVQRLLSELKQGTIGTIRMLSIREHRYPFLPKVNGWNRFNANTGGTMVEKCCHFWDLMRLLLASDPIRVYASAAADVNHQDERSSGARPDIIDNGFAIVDFANGARGSLDLCMFAEAAHWQEVITATGDLGQIQARIPGPLRFAAAGALRHGEVAIALRANKTELIETITTDKELLQAGDHHGATFFQHQQFIKLVKSDISQPEVSLSDGFWAVRVGEAAERSARTHQVVVL